jgi:hypothetical protein
MSLTQLSLARNTLIQLFPARESLVGDIPAGDGKMAKLFFYSACADGVVYGTKHGVAHNVLYTMYWRCEIQYHAL